MDARDYQRIVSGLGAQVSQAIAKACDNGMTRKTACGIVAAVAEVTIATNGPTGDILKSVETTAMLRFRAGIT